ncbi:MAG: LexA family protein [Methylobacter sp.]
MNDTPTPKRGGLRPGAGRKAGSSRYNEPTKPVRVPVSLLPGLQALLNSHRQPTPVEQFDAVFVPAQHPSKLPLPLFTGKVAAGFPSPADDYVDKTLDLNELLVQKPAATFFARAQGDSMRGAGIHPNDILVIDRSIEAVPGKIVVCALNGELTVKRLVKDGEYWKLHAENPAYPDIPIHDDLALVVWGVVTNVIHAL